MRIIHIVPESCESRGPPGNPGRDAGMGVEDVPLPAPQSQLKCTVKPRDGVLLLDRKLQELDLTRQKRLQFASSRRQRDLVSVGKLFFRQVKNIAFNAALLKLRDKVEYPHKKLLSAES